MDDTKFKTGRKKGTANKATTVMRESIHRAADVVDGEQILACLAEAFEAGRSR